MPTNITASPMLNWPFIGEIAYVFGYFEKLAYRILESFALNNAFFIILLMAILVNLCLLPIKMSQRKSIRLSSLTYKDYEKISKKYDYTDTLASKYREFLDKKRVQKKYGVKKANVIAMVCQLCVLMGLYASIYSIQYFVPELVPSEFFNFFGIDLSKSNSWSFNLTLLIPLSTFLVQYLARTVDSIAYRYKDIKIFSISTLLNSIITLLFAISFPFYLCLYWIFSDIINFLFDTLLDTLYYKRKSSEYFIERNLRKMNKKREKRGQFLITDEFEITDTIVDKEGIKSEASV